MRASTIHELQIGLKTRLSSALVADWRKLPFYRSLMRLPWSMARSNVVGVNLEPFDTSPTTSTARCCGCGGITAAERARPVDKPSRRIANSVAGW